MIIIKINSNIRALYDNWTISNQSFGFDKTILNMDWIDILNKDLSKYIIDNNYFDYNLFNDLSKFKTNQKDIEYYCIIDIINTDIDSKNNYPNTPYILVNHDAYIEKCSAIEYIIWPKSKRCIRNELYGSYFTKNYESYRYNLNQSLNNDSYKLGDKIKLKYPIRGLTHGYFIMQFDDGTCNILMNYSSNLNNKIVKWSILNSDDFDMCSISEIDSIIGHDLDFTMRWLNKWKFLYCDEYKHMLGLL